MTNSKIMTIKPSILRENNKFNDSFNKLHYYVSLTVDYMHLKDDSDKSDVPSDFIEWRLADMQTNLTRAKKALREIITNHNNNDNK